MRPDWSVHAARADRGIRDEVRRRLSDDASDSPGRLLDDLDVFWRVEGRPDAKRELLRLMFERVWLDDGRIVAVRPKEAFRPFFLGRQHKTAESGV